LWEKTSIQAQIDDLNSDISSFEKGGHKDVFNNYQTPRALSSIFLMLFAKLIDVTCWEANFCFQLEIST
jgi:hypothetical protein